MTNNKKPTRLPQSLPTQEWMEKHAEKGFRDGKVHKYDLLKKLYNRRDKKTGERLISKQQLIAGERFEELYHECYVNRLMIAQFQWDKFMTGHISIMGDGLTEEAEIRKWNKLKYFQKACEAVRGGWYGQSQLDVLQLICSVDAPLVELSQTVDMHHTMFSKLLKNSLDDLDHFFNKNR